MYKKLITISLLVLAAAAGGRAQDALGAQLQSMLELKSPSIVTIRAVIKTEFRGMDREMRQEVQGVVVGESGLIMTSNSPLSPTAGSDEGFKITPVEMKIVIGNEEKEYDAFFAAKDTKLDLAFLQIRELGDRTLTPIDFSQSTKVATGQQIVTISRLAKGYDYAPVYRLSRINGRIKKPRRAFCVDRAGDMGLPAFDLSGVVVGVNTRLESGIDEDGGRPNPFRFLMGGRGGGHPFVLPGKVVHGLVKQAITRAAEALEEERAKAAEKKPDEAGAGEKEGGKDGQDG